MRRFVSVALALVMSLCVSVPAFAADSPITAAPAAETVMPPTRLITKVLNQTNTADTVRVTAQPENGNYLRFYYRNDTEYKCTVYLLKVDGSSQTIAGAMSVAGNSQGQAIFFSVNAGSGTYKIRVENTENGGLVSGLTSLAQYHTLSDMEASSSGAVSPDLSGMPDSQLAYVDIYTAPPEAQQAILNARARIIYGNQAWTVNGAVSVFDGETGKVEALPEFSDVFPGWSLFEIRAAASGDPEIIASAIRLTLSGGVSPDYVPPTASGVTRKDNMIDFTEEGRLTTDFAASVPFTELTGNGNTVGIGAITDPCEGARYNLSISSGTAQIGWKPDLKAGQAVTFIAAEGRHYSVRGSVFSQEYEGHYVVQVTEDLNAFK